MAIILQGNDESTYSADVTVAGDVTAANFETAGNVILGDGGGIVFGTTLTSIAANVTLNSKTLDEYEEGEFTPRVRGTGVSGSATYNFQEGHYIRVGHVVHFWGRLGINSATGPTNTPWLLGFPFEPAAGINNAIFGLITTTQGSSNGLCGLIDSGNANGPWVFRQTTGGWGAAVIGDFVAAGTTLSFSGTYMID